MKWKMSGRTRTPCLVLTPQAVPAVLQPSQQLSDTAPSFKPREDGGGLELVLNSSAAFMTRYSQCRAFEHRVPSTGIPTLYVRAGGQGNTLPILTTLPGQKHLEGALELHNSLESSCLVSKDHVIWPISFLPFFVENLFSCYQCKKETFKNAQARGKKVPMKKKLKIREEMEIQW